MASMQARGSYSMPDKADKEAASSDEEDKKDGAAKKGIINRVNRACNHCRKMKMRCVGAENPPCKRCRNGSLECIMEKPGRAGAEPAGDERIRSLETQVSSMQSTLSDLVSTLRAGMSGGTIPLAAGPRVGGMGGMNEQAATIPPQFMQNTVDPALQYADHAGHGGFAQSLQDYTAFPPGFNIGFPPRQEVIGSDTASLHSRTQSSPYQMTSLGTSGFSPIDQSADAALRQLMSQVAATPIVPPTTQTKMNLNMSLPPSRAGSATPEDDDILGPEKINAPLESMSNMAGLVEAAVERAREETGKQQMAERPLKKARFGDDPVTSKKRAKKYHVHAYPDVIDEGIVGEAEARELFDIYFAGSSNFIPVYDPNLDTWDVLRKRSPFSISVIVMVGARVRDGGGAISDVQRLSRLHAQRIAVGTLFNAVTRIEAVQSMVLLAAFDDSGWLPGGHAVRMAIDMGINRSFIQLLRTGMGKGKSPEQLEEERHLVVHSRVWLCLYLIEHQMAYGMGRPAILREDETIHQCRRLLEHPLSITSDARLVSTVELTALRSPLHIELTATPDVPIAESTLRRLKQANADFDAWERYWDRVLSDRFGKSPADFFRESLVVQRQYAELFVNSQLLRGIREPHDVVSMPEEKRALAIRAMRNAQRCLEICLKGENYRNGLRYAVHYTHVCAAFAASFLIRIARLFPHELNLKKTAKDVEELAGVLATVPAGRYARSLRLILRRARRAKIIPAASVMPSPERKSLALPQTSMTPMDPSQLPFTPSQLINPSFQTTPSQLPAVSPSSMLLNTSQIINDSPASGSGGDVFEFDQLFAQDMMEKAGLKFGEGDQLPLFLDGQSLGASQAPTEMTNFVGIENFFLPADLDTRLADPSTSNGQLFTGEPLNEEVWW